MPLNLYDTMKPKGNFPAVEAEDVEMPDGSRLSDVSFNSSNDNDSKYFEIVDYRNKATICLKSEYRGAAINFADDSIMANERGIEDVGTALGDVVGDLVYFSKSDTEEECNEYGYYKEGSKIDLLPEVLHIPSQINGVTVQQLAPAMFAYNKRVKEIFLPQDMSAISIGSLCFAGTTNLTTLKNTENVVGIGYGSFFASGVEELSFPDLGNPKKIALLKISAQAFNRAGHLKKINVGKINIIDRRCFEFCSALETIEHDSTTKIEEVGIGAFFYTIALKNADFVRDLKKIGDYAFKCCGLNFDWSTLGLTADKFGARATPMQMNPSLYSIEGFEPYNIKTESCTLKVPLMIDQENPEWANRTINDTKAYAQGCGYFSVMNAYCGIKEIEYADIYTLEEINKAIDVEIRSATTQTEMDSYRKAEYLGIIIKYTGTTNGNFTNNHYYRFWKSRTDTTTYWHDLGADKKFTNLDFYMSNADSYSFREWFKNLGLVDERLNQDPINYNRIIQALQSGSYVRLNVPGGYDMDTGHAILLFGTKSNGEVLFVNTSIPGRNALGDYTAEVGSMPLQNLIIEGTLGCQIISEGTTKTQLNKTINQLTEADKNVVYFNINSDGIISLKPEYRGAAINFADTNVIKKIEGMENINEHLDTTSYVDLVNFSKSDQGFEKDGSKINLLPEVLCIPNKIDGIKVTKLAPAMFAYNKRVKQIILPQETTNLIIENMCFMNAINLTTVENTDNVVGIGYGSFFVSGVEELSFPNLTSLDKKAFMYAGHLKKINVGKINLIPERCFKRCNDLEEVIKDSTTKIEEVGVGAFFYAIALKKADFVGDLKKIGDSAFTFCGLNFDWSTLGLTADKFGARATPMQMNPSLYSIEGFEPYNIKTKACELPAPLRIDQSNAEWNNRYLNKGCNVRYGGACMYLSIMNAYCGICGLKYDEVYSLEEINKAIKLSDADIEESQTVPVKPENEYRGLVVKYTGSTDGIFITNHYYQYSFRLKSWVDLGIEDPSNLDLFFSSASTNAFNNWVSNLGLICERKVQIPQNFNDIIQNLQNGNYVMINVPRFCNEETGHAILLYGVKSNGEVLFVDSWSNSKTKIGDYTACVGSMPLQNLMSNELESENLKYFILKEGTTKAQLSETKAQFNTEIDDIYKILIEVVSQMNIPIMKTYSEYIQPETTLSEIKRSVDFEPICIIFACTTNSTSKISSIIPEPTDDMSSSYGIHSSLWVKDGQVVDGVTTDLTITATASKSKQSGSINTHAGTDSDSAISVVKNGNQWDIKIAGWSETSPSGMVITTQIYAGTPKGSSPKPLGYQLFVIGK